MAGRASGRKSAPSASCAGSDAWWPSSGPLASHRGPPPVRAAGLCCTSARARSNSCQTAAVKRCGTRRDSWSCASSKIPANRPVLGDLVGLRGTADNRARLPRNDGVLGSIPSVGSKKAQQTAAFLFRPTLANDAALPTSANIRPTSGQHPANIRPQVASSRLVMGPLQDVLESPPSSPRTGNILIWA